MNQEEMVIEVEVRNSEKKKKYFSEISRKIEEQKKEETSNDDIYPVYSICRASYKRICIRGDDGIFINMAAKK